VQIALKEAMPRVTPDAGRGMTMPGKGTGRQPQSAEHLVFGAAVRELRARRDLSQERLGQARRLHRNYFGAIERGEINPTFKIQLKLAHGLRVPLSELIALYEHRRTDHGLPAEEDQPR
jgi:DNA-binding XRE family transcriptional regulator